MANYKHPIVQVEFFHTVCKDSTLARVMLEGISRALEGGRIKTVLRFYDQVGDLAMIAERAEQLEELQHRITSDFFVAGHWHRKWLSLCSWWHQMESATADKELKRLVMERLEQTIRDPYGLVAIEGKEWRFSPLEDSAAHEVLEAAKATQQIRVFIYKPNDLLSDNVCVVASTMPL